MRLMMSDAWRVGGALWEWMGIVALHHNTHVSHAGYNSTITM